MLIVQFRPRASCRRSTRVRRPVILGDHHRGVRGAPDGVPEDLQVAARQDLHAVVVRLFAALIRIVRVGNQPMDIGVSSVAFGPYIFAPSVVPWMSQPQGGCSSNP